MVDTVEESFNYCQPKEIADPYDAKPDDWEEVDEIDDPDDIPPFGTELIPDKSSKRPTNWDEKIQGIWSPPLIKNPDFDPDWKPRKVGNPAFRGSWEPRMIPNPEYNPDPKFGKPEDLCYVGIDVEQDVSGCIWDNILVTDDIAYANTMMEETFFSIADKERALAAQAQTNEKGGKQKQKPASSPLPSDL